MELGILKVFILTAISLFILLKNHKVASTALEHDRGNDYPNDY